GRIGALPGGVAGTVPRHALFGAAVADDHLALHDARRAGDRVRLILINGHDLPDDLAVSGVERNQPSIERADINLAFVNGHAAIDNIAPGSRPTQPHAPLRTPPPLPP